MWKVLQHSDKFCRRSIHQIIIIRTFWLDSFGWHRCIAILWVSSLLNDEEEAMSTQSVSRSDCGIDGWLIIMLINPQPCNSQTQAVTGLRIGPILKEWSRDSFSSASEIVGQRLSWGTLLKLLRGKFARADPTKEEETDSYPPSVASVFQEAMLEAAGTSTHPRKYRYVEGRRCTGKRKM